MKEYFMTEIKPLHDDLTKKLNGHKVMILKIEKEVEVPVKLHVYTGVGHYENMTNIHLRNLRAMGLMV